MNAGPAGPRSVLLKAMLALLGMALFVSFLALGSWQLQRRAWKLENGAPLKLVPN